MTTARHQVFESSDGETRTLHQIVYSGWREGSVEQDGDAFLVDETRYTPVDDERET